MDFAAILLVALIAAVPSWLALRSHKAVQAQADSVKSIEAQVINGHAETNLRNDVDKALAGIQSVAEDVRGLRRDLLQEEDHRRLQVADLREEIEHRMGKHRRAI